MSVRKPEAIVVGGGVAGLMTAITLARRGVKVELIDRWEPGHSRATSADYNRVIAIAPFYFGESKIGRRDFLYGLLISTIGDRPIGIQAGQINAVAVWAARRFGTVEVEAVGPRTSLMTLIAAGIDGTAISSVRLNDSMTTLRDIINDDITVNQQPELFCFGLLNEFDVQELKVLAGPDRIQTGRFSEEAP